MHASRIAVIMLLLGTGAAAGQQPPVSTSHERAAAELVDVVRLEQVTTASIATMTDAMISQNPMLAQLRDVFISFFKEYVRWEELRPEYVRMYREAYSEAELNELIAFYRTPVGQKTVELMPVLMQRGAQIGQKQIQPHLPELQRRIEARLKGGA
jgi:uncharacterized protein